MKNPLYTLKALTASIILSSLLSFGCSSSTSTAPVVTGSHTLKQGDTFTYHDHQTDLSGAAVDGSDTTLTATVSILSNYQGKTNVAQIIKGADTAHFTATNDSSFFLLQDAVGISSSVMPALWIQFDPANNGKTVFDSTLNTTISGFPAKIHMTVLINYLGEGSTTINGTPMATYNYSKVVTVVVTVDKDYTTTITAYSNFAPTIGYLTLHNVKSDSDSPNTPVPNGYTYSELKTYLIQ